MRQSLTSDAIRKADELAVTKARVPSIELMETAGKRVSEHIASQIAGPLHATIFCGTGNNGGDGYVVARLLLSEGAHVDVISIGEPKSPDAATNYRRLQKLSGDFPEHVRMLSMGDLTNGGASLNAATNVIVDSLLGTGLSSPVRRDVAEAISMINESAVPTVSVDIPSGIDADTGIIHGHAVRADTTITFAALKSGLLLADGQKHAGHVEVADIGISDAILVEAAQEQGCSFVLEREDLATRLPVRSWSDHKYSAGTVGIIGGSTGLTGAPILSSKAAHRCGAGIVMCAVPESSFSDVSGRLLETMPIALPENSEGLTSEAVDEALRRLEKAQSIVIGPGLGRAKGTQEFVRDFLSQWDRVAVIDADALVALAPHFEKCHKPPGAEWILTPHSGEFSRFADLVDDRLEMARDFAATNELTLVLKGFPTILATATSTFISPGHKAFLTAGVGDVLAGMIGSFASQRVPPLDACICALQIGLISANNYCRTRSPLGMIASDLVSEIPVAINEAHRS